MKNHFKKTFQIMNYNIKTLLQFEIIYRLVGLAIIFPFARQLFFFSIRLTGHEFIVNHEFVDYLLSPSTIVLIIIVVLLIGLYITYEIVALSILFHSSYHQNKIELQTLIIASMKKMVAVFKQYHITIIISSTIFLFLVEGLHIVGIASTIQIPDLIIDQLKALNWFYPLMIVIVMTIFLLFFETIFYELQCTMEQTSIRDNFRHSHQILHHNFWKVFSEFFILNTIINLFLYLIYIIFLGIVALFVFVFRGESFVFGAVLTVLYSIYLIITFFASIVLIPINFAWINGWYYDHKQNQDHKTQESIRLIRQNRPFSTYAFRRLLLISSTILIGITILVFITQGDSSERIAFLNNPQIIAHRGGGDYGPENTLFAIEQGMELGADAVEIDVRFTLDSVPVLMHDETLGRTTNDIYNRKVANVTLEEIKELDAGGLFSSSFLFEQVPTLQEAFDFIDRRVDMYIEIKEPFPDSGEMIVSMIEEARMVQRVKILSFNKNILMQVKALNSDIETVLLLSSFFGDINALATNDYADNYGLYQQLALNNIEYVRTLQKAGKGVFVWTVNNGTRIREVNNLGVDGIITDSPRIAREIVYSDTTKSVYRKVLERLFVRN